MTEAAGDQKTDGGDLKSIFLGEKNHAAFMPLL